MQNASNLLDRAGDATLESCRAHGIAWVPYCPLGSAFAAWPKVTDDPVVQQVAREIEATAAQVGLGWLLHRAPNVLVIPGTRSRAHLAENAAAGELILTDELLRRLEAGATGARGRQVDITP